MLLRPWIVLNVTLLILSVSGSAIAQEAQVISSNGTRTGNTTVVTKYSKEQQEQYKQFARDGKAYLDQGRWSQAEKSFRDAMNIIPFVFAIDIKGYYARSLEMQGKTREALQIYRDFYGTGGIDSTVGPLWYGDLAAKISAREEAVAAYSRFILNTSGLQEDAQDYLGTQPNLRRLRTVALIAAGKTFREMEPRIRYFRQAVDSDRNCAVAQLALGQELLSSRTADREEARQHLQEAARLGRGSVQGKAQKALEIFK